jgi:hypothetical protein
LDDDDDINDEESVSTANTLTQAAAHATVNSRVTAPITVSADVMTAINTLAANQATIVQQMAAFSLGKSRPAQQVATPAVHVQYVPQQGTMLQVPPIPAIHVTLIQPYNQGGGYNGGYTQGRGGRNTGYGGRSAGYRHNGCGRNNHVRYDHTGRGGAIMP